MYMYVNELNNYYHQASKFQLDLSLNYFNYVFILTKFIKPITLQRVLIGIIELSFVRSDCMFNNGYYSTKVYILLNADSGYCITVHCSNFLLSKYAE